MHKISTDFKSGIVKLKIDDPDDAWYLTHLIEPGDSIRGKTTRKIKIGEGENAKTTKKTVTLTIAAETVELEPSGTSIRINGKITEGPDYIPTGNYQAISLQEGDEFTLTKLKWLAYQKKKLDESTQKKYNYLLCLFDREEALFAITKKSGYQTLTTIKGDVPKKSKIIDIKTDFQQEIIEILSSYSERYNPDKIILASPAFYKEDLLKKIRSPELKKNIVLATCSDVTDFSLDEVIRRPELKAILKDSRSREEQALVDELLSEINKNNLAVYGEKDTLSAIDSGAVNKLLLTDNFISEKKKANTFTKIDEKMKIVDSINGEIHIISSKNDSGKRLDGLGGIAAILRYKT